MARLTVSKRKQLICMFESVRCLLNVFNLLQVFLVCYMYEGLDGLDFSNNQTQPSPTGTSLQKSRKSIDDWTRGMLEVSSSINKLVDGTMVYFDKISSALTEDSTTNKQVAKELQKLDGLSTGDIMDAGKSIMNDSFMSTLFLSFSTEKRREMVFYLLKKWLLTHFE